MNCALTRCGAAVLLAGALSAGAIAEGLPETFAWTAYGKTSSGYAASVAIGKALVAIEFVLGVANHQFHQFGFQLPLWRDQTDFASFFVAQPRFDKFDVLQLKLSQDF